MANRALRKELFGVKNKATKLAQSTKGCSPRNVAKEESLHETGKEGSTATGGVKHPKK